jgi:hypothetical protein
VSIERILDVIPDLGMADKTWLLLKKYMFNGSDWDFQNVEADYLGTYPSCLAITTGPEVVTPATPHSETGSEDLHVYFSCQDINGDPVVGTSIIPRYTPNACTIPVFFKTYTKPWDMTLVSSIRTVRGIDFFFHHNFVDYEIGALPDGFTSYNEGAGSIQYKNDLKCLEFNHTNSSDYSSVYFRSNLAGNYKDGISVTETIYGLKCFILAAQNDKEIQLGLANDLSYTREKIDTVTFGPNGEIYVNRRCTAFLVQPADNIPIHATIDHGDPSYTAGVLIFQTAQMSYADYNTDEDFTYSLGDATGTLNGTASVSGGLLDLHGGSIAYIDYDAVLNGDSRQKGCVRIRITPNYSGSPATKQQFFLICKSSISSLNRLGIYHDTSGDLNFIYTDFSGSGGTINLGAWSPGSGTEYEFEFNWDLDSGESRLFIGGTQFGSTITVSHTRDENIGLIRIGAPLSVVAANFYSNYFMIFSEVQHIANYSDVNDYPLYDKIYFDFGSYQTLSSLRTALIASSYVNVIDFNENILSSGTEYWEGNSLSTRTLTEMDSEPVLPRRGIDDRLDPRPFFYSQDQLGYSGMKSDTYEADTWICIEFEYNTLTGADFIINGIETDTAKNHYMPSSGTGPAGEPNQKFFIESSDTPSVKAWVYDAKGFLIPDEPMANIGDEFKLIGVYGSHARFFLPLAIEISNLMIIANQFNKAPFSFYAWGYALKLVARGLKLPVNTTEYRGEYDFIHRNRLKSLGEFWIPTLSNIKALSEFWSDDIDGDSVSTEDTGLGEWKINGDLNKYIDQFFRYTTNWDTMVEKFRPAGTFGTVNRT